MSRNRQRQRIAWEAARLLCNQEELEFYRARWRAVVRVHGSGLPRRILPGQREIHEEVARRERALDRDSFGLPQEQGDRQGEEAIDRFRLYETLLLPLEQVHESRRTHPEGDVLYHSLQVFELAKEELPYDEEFLLAALLHDVGKAIDPQDHIGAGLEALDGAITARTAWFIEHHGEALLLYEGKLGVRSRRRLEAVDDFPELQLLAECDRRGRVRGMSVGDVTDALDYLRDLDAR